MEILLNEISDLLHSSLANILKNHFLKLKMLITMDDDDDEEKKGVMVMAMVNSPEIKPRRT